MSFFEPGDYIVTREGQKGYVVDRLSEPSTNSYVYQIRWTHGYGIQKSEDLKLDPLLGKEEIK